jgi:predicted transposase/invertase (TIGR01784 family)
LIHFYAAVNSAWGDFASANSEDLCYDWEKFRREVWMSRYLNPRSDLVFKKIFGEHANLLVSFLNSMLPLPPDGLIVSLSYLPTEQIPQLPLFKRTIVDVKCTDQQGRIFITEMQLSWTTHFMKRLLFGASRAYVNQLERGEEYEYLKPVYGLGLLSENFDHESSEFYHHYQMVNVQKPERELKGLELIFVELPKFKPTSHAERKLQILWLRFLSEVNEKSRDIDPALLAVPEIRKAVELSEEAAYTKADLEAYHTYWDWVSSEKTLFSGRFREGEEVGEKRGLEKGLELGEKKGLELGEKKGKAEEKILIAKSLLAQKVAIPIIASATSLSEAEIVGLEKES